MKGVELVNFSCVYWCLIILIYRSRAVLSRLLAAGAIHIHATVIM